MSQEVNIVVDDREVRSDIVEILHAFDEVSIEVRRLPLGDYEVGDRLLVERKAISGIRNA
ncbi:hypothetical protein N9H39_06775 [Gammaproteobacteria bacterium]|nr:hypothetical protein [Gammaproteobacteria bacterium]